MLPSIRRIRVDGGIFLSEINCWIDRRPLPGEFEE